MTSVVLKKVIALTESEVAESILSKNKSSKMIVSSVKLARMEQIASPSDMVVLHTDDPTVRKGMSSCHCRI